MAKRMLVTVVAGLALLGGAAKVVADEVARGANEAYAAYKSVPKPIKKVLGQLAKQEAEDVVRAACRLKDSSDIEQEARRSYWDRGEYMVGLIIRLAREMQVNPEVRVLCTANL